MDKYLFYSAIFAVIVVFLSGYYPKKSKNNQPYYNKDNDTTSNLPYHEWLRQSLEWRDIRHKVWRRDRFLCQGCLTNRAEATHHLTYRFGRIPPAWHLVSICNECHDKIHSKKDAWSR